MSTTAHRQAGRALRRRSAAPALERGRFHDVIVDGTGNVVEVPVRRSARTSPSRRSQPMDRGHVQAVRGSANVFRASAGTFIQSRRSSLSRTCSASRRRRTPTRSRRTALRRCRPTARPASRAKTPPTRSQAAQRDDPGQRAAARSQHERLRAVHAGEAGKAFSADFGWSHDFTGGLTTRITPYYRKGTNYTITSQSRSARSRTAPRPLARRSLQPRCQREHRGRIAVAKSAVFGFSAISTERMTNTLRMTTPNLPRAQQRRARARRRYDVSYLVRRGSAIGRGSRTI